MPLSRRFSGSSTTQCAACAAWNALIALLPRLECLALRRFRVFACPCLAASMVWAGREMPLLRAGTSWSCRCSGLRHQGCAAFASEYAYVALLRLPRRATRSVREFRAVPRVRPANLLPDLSRHFREGIRVLLAASAARAALALHPMWSHLTAIAPGNASVSPLQRLEYHSGRRLRGLQRPFCAATAAGMFCAAPHSRLRVPVSRRLHGLGQRCHAASSRWNVPVVPL